MAMRDPHGQKTYLVSELTPGAVYRDALSGYLVLVMEKTVMEKGDKDPRVEVQRTRTVGWYYNPTLGQHKEMELHDGQLILGTRETSLMPDTRYDKGHHGH